MSFAREITGLMAFQESFHSLKPVSEGSVFRKARQFECQSRPSPLGPLFRSDTKLGKPRGGLTSLLEMLDQLKRYPTKRVGQQRPRTGVNQDQVLPANLETVEILYGQFFGVRMMGPQTQSTRLAH